MTNTAPTITSGDQTGSITEIADLAAGENVDAHTQTGTVTFEDVDLSDTPTASVDSQAVVFRDADDNVQTLPAGGTSEQAFKDAFSIDAVAGNTNNGGYDWTYATNDLALDFLAKDETVTVTSTVKVDDGNGGTATQDVVVTITGTNDAPEVTSGDQTGSITEIADLASGENVDAHTQTGTVTFEDVDLSDTPTASVDSQAVVFRDADDNVQTLPAGGTSEQAFKDAFSIDAVAGNTNNGGYDWTYAINDLALDFLAKDETVTVTSTVKVDDGNGGTATQDVVVTITGTNDAPEANDDAKALAERADSVRIPASVSGNVIVGGTEGDVADTDVDLSDVLTVIGVSAGTGSSPSGANVGIEITGAYGSLTIDAFGNYTYTLLNTDALITGENDTDVFVYEISDGNGGTVQATLTFTVSGTDLDLTITDADDFPFYGQRGHDIIRGRAVADEIHGAGGNDTLYGYGGEDKLYGDAGNDTLIGGAGKDTLVGGDGDDSFDLASGDFVDGESIDGGADNGSPGPRDRIVLTEGQTVDFSKGTIAGIEGLIGSAGDDTVTLTAAQWASLSSIDLGAHTLGDTLNVLADGSNLATPTPAAIPELLGIETGNLIGTAGNDSITLTGAQLNAIVFGTAGKIDLGDGANDTINLTSTSSALNSIGGTDNTRLLGVETISAAGAGTGVTITLSAQSEKFTVTGSAHDDTLTGGGNDDTITGGAGKDTLSGGGGNDTFNLASGDFAADESIDGGLQSGGDGDRIVLTGAQTVDFSKGTVTGIETLTGSDGDDNVTLAAAQWAALAKIGLGAQTLGDVLNVLADGSNITASPIAMLTGIETGNLIGTANADSITLTGAQLDAIVIGAAGKIDLGDGVGDTINLTSTSATLNSIGVNSNARLDGVEAISAAGAGAGVTIALSAQTENFAITGSAHGDDITGGLGVDTILAGNGDDTIRVNGAEAKPGETYDGGIGTDTLRVSGTADFTGSIINSIERLIMGSTAIFTSDQLGAGLSSTLAVTGNPSADDTVTINVVDSATIVDLTGWTFTSWTPGPDDDRIVIDGAGRAGALDLTGSSQHDQIRGGLAGDDIDGGAGNDILDGGAGNDTLDGNTGNDTVDYSWTTGGVNVNLALGTASDRTIVEAGSDTLTRIENVRGGSGADMILGDALANILEGNGGTDSIWGAGGDDTIYGGDGSDILIGGSGSTLVNGVATDIPNSGNDTLYGGEGDDQLYGQDGNDTLWGGNGVDQYAGGAGSDTLYFEADGANDIAWGGSGNDTFVFQAGVFGIDTIKDFVAVAGANQDKIDLRAFPTVSWATLIITQLPNGNVEITSPGLGVGNKIVLETLNAGALTATNFIFAGGGASLPTISGNNNANSLVGTAANEILNGNGGNDTLDGRGGGDILNGGAGTDTATYANSPQGVNVSLTTGFGSGGDAEGDMLVQIENIVGSSHNDVIEGSSGANNLNGGAGIDTLTYQNASAGVRVSLAVTGAQNTQGAGSDTISNFENLTGSNFNDNLTGNSGANVIDGRAGNDTITTGGGDDTVIFKPGYGAETVTDFVAGGTLDKIDLSAFDGIYSLADVIARASTGTSTVINLSDLGQPGDQITLTGVNRNSLTSADFIFALPPKSGAPPTAIDLTSNIVLEGAPLGTVIGDLATTDADFPVQTFTYSLVNSAGGLFAIDGNQLVVAGTLNYEVNGTHTYSVTVRVTDSGYQTFDQVFVIDVANFAPTELTDSNNAANTVAENAAVGTVVAGLALTTDDPGGGVAYSLTNNAGGRFAINPVTGIVTVANGSLLDYETATSHIITVSATDGSPGSTPVTRDIVINLTDVAGPTINGTSANNTLNGTGEGETINGNGGNDTIRGFGGNDTLNGGSGADTMYGGAGADIYIVDNTNDRVNEEGNTGDIDTVQSSVTFSLNSPQTTGEVENLTLTGSSNINATGNDLANVLTGNSGNNVLTGNGGGDTLIGNNGNDTLNGGTGADRLIGGGGTDALDGGVDLDVDTFVFTAAVTSQGIDTIANFVSGTDVIEISAAGFGGGLVAGADAVFIAGATLPGSAPAGAYFFFDNSGTGAGTLYFDPDGGSSGNAVAFARLTSGSMTGDDIIIV